MAPKLPASLVRYVRSGRCVLFCGSGLSAWGKLPTWRKLLDEIVKHLAEEVPDDPHLDELRRLLQAEKLLDVADHCKEALGRRYHEILSEQLRGEAGEIPEPHKVIAQTPFSAVVTTNYDKLLERSYASLGSLPKAPTHLDVDALGPLLFDGSFFILKAHGDIDRPEGMVLTTRDYQEIIHSNLAFNSIFSAILLTKAVLFVGYSLNDPDFRLLLDRQLTIFKGNVPERYALMSGVGKVERDVLWRTSRIRVLSYDEGQHRQVLDFLQTLHEQVCGEPVAEVSAVPFATGKPALGTSGKVAAVQAHVSALPSTTLSMRLHGTKFEVGLSDGSNSVQGVGTPPDWAFLTKLITRALTVQTQARLLGLELANLLPDAIVQALSHLPKDHIVSLQLSPQVELLPWEMTNIAGEFLSLRNPLVRAPVGVSNTARGYPIINRPARVLLIGDPNQNDGMSLPGALAEVQEIADVYQGQSAVVCDSLIGAAATFDNVAVALSSGNYDVVHFAGHAWFDDDLEPFLFLSGQTKLRSSELRSIISPRPPAVLILNSHFTIFTPPGGAGEHRRMTGIEEAEPASGGQRAFIEAATVAGVGILIGSFSGALDDTIARKVGVNLHRALIEGTPVAKALHQSLLLKRPVLASENPSHLTYAMSGYGEIAMPV